MPEKISDISAMDFLTQFMKNYKCNQHKFMTYNQKIFEQHMQQTPHYFTDTIQCDICSQIVKVKSRFITFDLPRIVPKVCDRCKDLNVTKVFK